MLSNEKLIKKRSRWLGAESCARLVNEFCDTVNYANEIRITNKQEFEERHCNQTKAIALLTSVAKALTRCLVIAGMDNPQLIGFGQEVNEELKLLRGWQRSDEKHYSQFFGGKIQPPEDEE